MTQTWTPEPIPFTPVEAFDPLYASWSENPGALFEVEYASRKGGAPRSFFVDADTAIALHRQGNRVYQVR